MIWKTPEKLIEKIIEKSRAGLKDKIEQAWEELDESSKADIVTFRNGRLIINVKNNAWLQELTFKREEIKEKMNKSLKGAVKEIRLRLGG